MKKKKQYKYFMVLVLIVALCLIGIKLYVDKNDDSKSIVLDSGWTIYVNDEVYPNITLSEFKPGIFSKGDQIKLVRTLPNEKMLSPILYFYSVYSVVTVSVDDLEIYSYGKELNKQNKFLGYGALYTTISEDYCGKTLCLKYEVTEDEAFSDFEIPKIYNSRYFYKMIVKKDLLQIIINQFISIFGISIFIVAIFIHLKKQQKLQMLYLGLFSVGISLYSLCCTEVISFVASTIRIKTNMEFFVLYSFPMFVFLYFCNKGYVNKRKCVKYIYNSILICQAIYSAIVFFLHITGVAHFPRMLIGEHIIMIIMFLYVCSLQIREVLNKRYENVIILIGVIGMVIFSLFDIVIFYLVKYTNIFDSTHFTSVSCIGVLILSMSLILDFCMQLTEGVYDKAEKMALEYYAYTDGLTGIANRRRCEDEFDNIENSKQNYAVLSIDLNGFKQINDKYGHDYGDTILKTFSKILTETFSKFGLVGRMGGDEFIVIFRNTNNLKISDLTEKMNLLIEEKNIEYNNLLSVSYGFCTDQETDSTKIREVYKIADERMYEMKAKKKKKG